jgi:hypothetical protein
VPLRLVRSTLVAVLLGLAVLAAYADAGIKPGLVHRGDKTTLSLKTGTRTAPCYAQMRYADNRIVRSATRQPRKGSVSFIVRIPATAALGQGSWRIQCGLGYATGTFVVVDTKSTDAVNAPRVVAATEGFSQRADKSGPGSLLSYGVVLKNTSPTEDARNVYVIVNMVGADGSLIGSRSQTIDVVPAGSVFPLGNSLQLRTQSAVTHLELTIRVGAHQPKSTQVVPALANVRVLPNIYDPGWVGEVDGEVVNDNTPKTLSSAQLSVVVLDAAGVPLGGGTGYVYAPVPFGSRFVFVASNGFKAIPLDHAASAVIGIAARYVAPTS